MNYNFENIIDRKNTNSLKHDFMIERGMPEDVLPLWVADMDFESPECVKEEIIRYARKGVFGYSEIKADYAEAIINWYRTYFGYHILPEHIATTPGVVFSIATAIRAFTEEGDAILIQEPVYYPFRSAIISNHRQLVHSDLIYKDGHYEIDFTDFEKKIKENQVKMFILCSPHNPVGRVWKRWELEKLAQICMQYGVLVISDEIHSDFVWEGHAHTVFATLSEEVQSMTITCTSPSKTFNLAGLQASNIIIADKEKREKFLEVVHQSGYGGLSIFGIAGTKAAYTGGREWLEKLKEYLGGNLSFIREYLEKYIPKLHLVEPEGTYLVWVDFRELNMTEEEREKMLIHQAGLWLDKGSMFGKAGEGFERINIACPREVLKKAMNQLKKALD